MRHEPTGLKCCSCNRDAPIIRTLLVLRLKLEKHVAVLTPEAKSEIRVCFPRIVNVEWHTPPTLLLRCLACKPSCVWRNEGTQPLATRSTQRGFDVSLRIAQSRPCFVRHETHQVYIATARKRTPASLWPVHFRTCWAESKAHKNCASPLAGRSPEP